MSKLPWFTLGCVCLALSMVTIPAQAQYGTLPIGTLGSSFSVTCPGAGWYHYDTQQGSQYVHCFQATVTGCAGANDLTLTFGFLDPVGIVPNTPMEKGVIVLHSGQEGTSPAGDDVGISDGDFKFADYYFRQGYEVVEIAWDSAWEATQNPFPPAPPPFGNVQLAACRPATLFNYIFNNIYLPIYNNINPHAGMCGHGFSAGSGAIAYAMAYFKPPVGTQWWWDNVELLAGPQFGDVKQGCAVGPDAAPPVTVCGQNNGNQWGCRLGTGDTPWSSAPQYVGASIGWAGGWTNDHTCANIAPASTSAASELRWLQQSIVDDGTNSPVFSYPHTAMAGWVCRTIKSQESQGQCNTAYDQHFCPNNSSSQGQLFYATVTANGAQPSNYAVYPVNLCTGAEGVGGGTLSLNGQTGYVAIEQDMAGGPNNQPAAQCVHRP